MIFYRCITLLILYSNSNYAITDEAIMNVRTLSGCSHLKIQEFARLKFVDDVLNHDADIEDYEPLAKRPTYHTDIPKIVCS